jgi:hypothetical protein
MAVIIEVILTSKTLLDKKSSLLRRFQSFIYIICEELMKGLFLPYYFVKKSKVTLKNLVAIASLLTRWELDKINSLVRVYV